MKILLTFGLFINICFAQSDRYKDRQSEAERQKREWEKSQEEAVKRWREQMEADRALIQKYFKSDLFKQFDKDVDDVLKSFNPKDFQKFFDDDNFGKMFKQAQPFKDLRDGDSKWIETPKEKILILKMTMEADAPFEIKIENNHIVVKGSIVEKREQKTAQGSNFYESKRMISKTFPVPSDVDPDRAKFENKAGEVLIKLPKKKVSDLYQPPKKSKKKKPRPGLTPIPKSDSDLTI